MKIVFTNAINQIGGGERSLLDLLAALPAAAPGSERHLVVLAPPGPLQREAAALGVTVHSLPMPDSLARLGDSGLKGRGTLGAGLALLPAIPALAAGGIPFLLRLRRLLAEIDPDLVHSNAIKSHVLLRLAAPERARVIWHVRDFVGARPAAPVVLRWAARRADLAIAVSRAVAGDLRSSVDPPMGIQVVNCGIDLARFSPGLANGALLDRSAALPAAPPGTLRVGLIATYARWKGQSLFMRAAARVLETRPQSPVRFYIVGGPIYGTTGSEYALDELRTAARSLGVADSVAFVPFTPETTDVYRSLDIVVHASTEPEPLGRTIVEAMACGRPVIASLEGGAAEVFTSGDDAVGFAPRDPDALAAELVSMLDDTERRSALGVRARETAVARYGRDRHGSDVAALYEALV